MRRTILLLCVFWSMLSVAQESVIHKVEPGETIYSIGRTYDISPSAIIAVNPEIDINNISVGQKIIIPSKDQIIISNETDQDDYHILEKGDTWYNLSKKYGVSVEELQSLNPNLVDAFNIGSRLKIPNGNTETQGYNYNESASKNTQTIVNQEIIEHWVEPKETLFGLSKKYNVSIDNIVAQNPQIKEKGLQIGQKLTIKTTNTASQEELPFQKTVAVNNEASKVAANDDFIEYKVKEGQTLFGILNKFNITLEDLVKYNPSLLSDGLVPGTTLKIPKNKDAFLVSNKVDLINIGSLPDNNDFIRNRPIVANGKAVRLVYILPFYANNPSKRSRSVYAADFYLGSELALDDIKAMGAQIDAIVLDSEESAEKTLSQVEEIKEFDPTLIIGPLFTEIVDTLADALPDKIIISPFSKNHKVAGKNNLFCATPSHMVNENIMLEYIKSNVLTTPTLVTLPEGQESVRELIKLKGVRMNEITFDELMAKDSIQNGEIFVFTELNRSQTNQALDKTKKWSSKTDYRVIFMSDNGGFKGQDENFLRKIQYTYPNYIERRSGDYQTLVEKLRSKYNALPNTDMIRGYEITYDAVLRYLKNGDMLKSVDRDKTNGYYLYFNYAKLPNGGIFNHAVEVAEYKLEATPIKQ